MKPNGMGLSARRISIVGSTGSGKTYLARILSRRLDLPLKELDDIRGAFLPGSHAQAEFTKAVAQLVEQNEWVIDGHYRDVRHLIWSCADMVVHLNYSLPVIGTQLLSRFMGKYQDGRRPALDANASALNTQCAATSPASASWSRRISRLAKTVRERGEYTRIFDGSDYRDLTVLELKSPRATDQWLASLDYRPENCEASAITGKEGP